MNDDGNKYDLNNQENIPQSPDYRNAEEGISMEVIRREKILTPQQVAEMEGEYTFEIKGTEEINGEVVEVITVLYRIDVLGNKIGMDDTAGFSWSDTARKDPIPGYLKSQCVNLWKHHGFRMVYLYFDGEPVGKKGVVLCTECFKHLENTPLLLKILYKLKINNL